MTSFISSRRLCGFSEHALCLIESEAIFFKESGMPRICRDTEAISMKIVV